MKVILRQNFNGLGQIGEVINVKDGYARNYLIPRKFAYPALQGNVRALEEEKKNLEKKKFQELSAAERFAAELEKISVTNDYWRNIMSGGSVGSMGIAVKPT